MSDDPAEDDLRARLDPLEALLAVRPRWRHIPESLYQPQPDEDGNLPDPEVVPARDELYTDPAGLPPEALRDGAVDLAGQVSLLHSALAWMWDRMEIRQVIGFNALPNGTYPPLSLPTLDIEWNDTPDKLPNYAAVTAISGTPAAMNSFGVIVEAGSVTMTGCRLQLGFWGPEPVVVDDANPLVLTAAGTYLFVPPYEPEEGP